MKKAFRPDRSVEGRKRDHLQAIIDDPAVERYQSGFDRIALTHRALPELNLDDVDTSTEFLGKPLKAPILISSMTGAADEEMTRINRNLAEAAEAAGVAMAVGSQRVMFSQPEARASFDLRPHAPSVPLISNIGAVQLNAGLNEGHCKEAVSLLQADGLYLHLNPLQEAVQPEGDRDFSGLGDAIARLIESMPVPVLVKEVGAGLSGPDIELAYRAGVRHFDVAGRGGTSWSRIEYHRREDDEDDLGLLFQDWGLTTVESLVEAREALAGKSEATALIASGGIRNGIDMAKSLVLGADLCGTAAPFLSAAKVSTEAVVSRIEKLRRELQTAMFLLGCADITTIKANTSLLRPRTRFE